MIRRLSSDLKITFGINIITLKQEKEILCDIIQDFLRVNLIYTDSIYIIIVKCIIHMQNLEFQSSKHISPLIRGKNTRRKKKRKTKEFGICN
mgnify:CR=1 FL=1